MGGSILPRWLTLTHPVIHPVSKHFIVMSRLGYVVDGAGEAVAEVIRHRVREETRLTCSCGIGPNRLLAKVFYLCVLLSPTSLFHRAAQEPEMVIRGSCKR